MSLSRSASICSDTARIESSPSDRADGSAALVRGENQLRVRPYLPIYERFVGPGFLNTAESHVPGVVGVSEHPMHAADTEGADISAGPSHCRQPEDHQRLSQVRDAGVSFRIVPERPTDHRRALRINFHPRDTWPLSRSGSDTRWGPARRCHRFEPSATWHESNRCDRLEKAIYCLLLYTCIQSALLKGSLPHGFQDREEDSFGKDLGSGFRAGHCRGGFARRADRCAGWSSHGVRYERGFRFISWREWNHGRARVRRAR